MRTLLVALLLLAPLALADHPQSAGSNTIVFDHKGGNEYWVEVAIGGASASQVRGVEAKDDNGAWTTLTKRSWGHWAASFRIEPGHLVAFRATMADGSVIESCRFTHPAGAEQCVVPPPPGGAYATFDHKGGNEWWVEVRVVPQPGRQVDEVLARDDNGAWTPLTLRSWGNWAGSFRIEPGHRVQFQAAERASSGDAWRQTSCWFTHPAGVQQCDEPPTNATFDASFSSVKGNRWWVETKVTGNQPVAAVHARVDAGEWRTLTKRSWGAWAASFEVPDGALVQFRATSATGMTDLSGRYRWPEATLVDDGTSQQTWPREGSYVKYFTHEGTSVPGYSDETETNVTLTWAAGRWEAVCEGRQTQRVGDEVTVERFAFKAALDPPRTKVPASPRDGEIEMQAIASCRPETYIVVPHNETTYTGARKNGAPVASPAYFGDYEVPDCPCGGASAYWHKDTGLTLRWSWYGRYSHEAGHIVDTDAPIALGDARLPAPPAPAWPKEGSFVRYDATYWSNSSDAWGGRTDVSVSFSYSGGKWTSVCNSTTYRNDGTVEPWTFESPLAPPEGPLRIGSGDHVQINDGGCYMPHNVMVAKAMFPEDTTRNGAPHRAKVWWADETDEAEAMAHDHDAWWDTATGLLIRWEDRDLGEYPHAIVGHLVDTDAPLSRG